MPREEAHGEVDDGSTRQGPFTDFAVNLSNDQWTLITKAATMTEQTVAQFALDALLTAAHRKIEQARVTTLTRRDHDRFLRALDDTSEPDPRLRAAAERFGRPKDRPRP